MPKAQNEDWCMAWESQMKNPNNLMKRRIKRKKQRRQKQKSSRWKKNKDSNVLAKIGTTCSARSMQET